MAITEAMLKLSEMSGKRDSKAFHAILECAMTPEEAEFLIALPSPNADLAAKLNTTEKEVEGKIQGLAQRGLVTASRRGPRYPRDPGTLHDNILASDPKYIPQGIEKLWMDLYEGEEWWQEIAINLASIGDRILRVIPAVRSIPPDVKLLPCESVVEIIKAHKDLISVRRCCCRVGAKKCDHPLEVCLQFGRRAEYDLYRGSGRKISADEAIEIGLIAEDAGLMPNVTNVSPLEALEYICYCCGCACMCLNPALRYGNVNEILAPSRFLVRVDNDKLKSYEIEPARARCYFDAIEEKQVPGSDKPQMVIIEEKCVGCGLCVSVVESGALTMEMVRPPEFIPETIAGPAAIVHGPAPEEKK